MGWAIKYRDQQGDQHWEGGFDRRGAAQKRLNVVLPEVDSGRYIPRQDATFEVFANQWLAGRLRVRGYHSQRLRFDHSAAVDPAYRNAARVGCAR